MHGAHGSPQGLVVALKGCRPFFFFPKDTQEFSIIQNINISHLLNIDAFVLIQNKTNTFSVKKKKKNLPNFLKWIKNGPKQPSKRTPRLEDTH